MAKNKILNEINLFQRKEGKYWQSAHTFSPGPLLESVLKQFPKHSSFFLQLSQDGQHVLHLLEGTYAGWRVNVADYYIYIATRDLPPDSPDWQRAHEFCLCHNIYHANHSTFMEYWNQPDDEYNKAEDYAASVDADDAVFLCKIVRDYCPGTASAIEIGCNVGRHLHNLKGKLGMEVAGFEYSEYALKKMTEFFPDLAGITTFQGEVQKRILEVADKSYDLVYSSAVLMHLHPDTSADFWRNIPRIARKHIITIENELGGTNRNWPRNYQQLLEPHGAKQIKLFLPGETVDSLAGYTVRIFSVH